VDVFATGPLPDRPILFRLYDKRLGIFELASIFVRPES
jgi:hypothetical protein